VKYVTREKVNLGTHSLWKGLWIKGQTCEKSVCKQLPSTKEIQEGPLQQSMLSQKQDGVEYQLTVHGSTMRFVQARVQQSQKILPGLDSLLHPRLHLQSISGPGSSLEKRTFGEESATEARCLVSKRWK
jgi:hypothetical protein